MTQEDLGIVILSEGAVVPADFDSQTWGQAQSLSGEAKERAMTNWAIAGYVDTYDGQWTRTNPKESQSGDVFDYGQFSNQDDIGAVRTVYYLWRDHHDIGANVKLTIEVKVDKESVGVGQTSPSHFRLTLSPWSERSLSSHITLKQLSDAANSLHDELEKFHQQNLESEIEVGG